MTTCSNCGFQADFEFQFCPKCGTKRAGGPEDTLIGRILSGKFRIEGEIGSGSMGTVYLAEHLALKKKVALKILHSDMQISEESLQRFQREGIAAGKFNHPGLIQIFDFDKDEQGTFYLAMEYLEGLNLKAFLAKKKKLSSRLAVDIITQILSVLAEAHAHGIVHRDLKPDNIMVMENPSGSFTVKVLDFGLSKLVDIPMSKSMQTQVGRILGTPLYMAPEQCAGDEADARSDIYAAGLILYELLTGITAFPDESTTEILFSRPTREAPSILNEHGDLGIPPDLDGVIQCALQRRRDDRYQTVDEMLADLDEVRYPDTPEGSRGVSRLRSTSRSRGANPAAPLTGGAAGGRAGASSETASTGAGLPRVVLLVLLVVVVAGLGVWGALSWLPGGAGNAGASDSAAVRVREKAESERTPQELRYGILLDQAESAYRRGDLSSALNMADEAILTECVDADAYLLRARIRRSLGDLAIAFSDARAAVSADSDYGDAWAEQGLIQWEQDDAQAAEVSFRRAIAEDAQNVEALTGLGRIAKAGGRRDEARALLEQAADLKPNAPQPVLELGWLHLEEGEVDFARDAFERALRNDSRSASAREGLGRVHLELDEIGEAESEFLAALQLDAGRTDIVHDVALLMLENERFSEAKSLLERTLKAAHDPELSVLLALTLERSGDVEAAQRALEGGLERGGKQAEAAALLGLLRAENGDAEAALEAFDQALELDERCFAAHRGRGLVLASEQRYREAAEALALASAIDPNDADTHFVLGVLHMEYLGNVEDALVHLSTYDALDGSDARVKGWIRELDR